VEARHWTRHSHRQGYDSRHGRPIILSPLLCARLEEQNITFLAQVSLQTRPQSLLEDWLDSDSLLLEGTLALEWMHYTSALKGAGITLTTEPDLLLWAGGDATGSVTVKNLYAAYLKQLGDETDRSWFRLIWKWQVPLKQKIFTWLAGRERILTWEALRRRGWEGPGICSLCKQDSEDIHHLLVHCHFTKQIWKLLINYFSLSVAWKGPTFSACLTDWVTQKSAPPTWRSACAGRFGRRETLLLLKTVSLLFWRSFTE
jgi:hypothetical protein